MSENYRNDQNKNRDNQFDRSQQTPRPQGQNQNTPKQGDRPNDPFNKNRQDKHSNK